MKQTYFFQLTNMRYEKHQTIIATYKSFNKWSEVFENLVIAIAILDKLLHHSRVFSIIRPSYQAKDKMKYFSDNE